MPVEIRRQIPRWAVPLTKPARYKGASGGRSSGKSHFMAEEAVEAMVCDPSLRFVCIREVQRSLKFSAKALVESKIQSLGVSGLFEVLEREIRRRGGTGVMIFEGMQDHTSDSIKSLEGFGRAWVEEAQSISKRSLDLLLPTIRADNSEIWFSWNPDQQTDPVDEFFAHGVDGGIRVHTTYLDNPFCPDVMRTEADRLKVVDADSYEHIWGGGYFLGGAGRVYSSFTNKPSPLGNIDESVTDTGAEILVGQDFNVNPMASVIAVRVGDECHVLDSLEVPSSNTEEVAAEIKRRYPGRRIIVCPDPSGKARKSSAPVGQTDFTILQRAGFEVRAPNAAPLVVDRVNNAQKMFFDLDTGRRRVRIHPRATAYITALANQTFKEGTSIPDKRGGFDHQCFAAGTPVQTIDGPVSIENIREGDMVLTRSGYFPVAAAGMISPNAEVWAVSVSNGARLTVTPDHPFWIEDRGFTALRDLMPSDTLITCHTLNQSSIKASCFAATPTQKNERIASTSLRGRAIGDLALIVCTARSGRIRMGQFLTAIISTTLTATRSITTSRTWLALWDLNISAATPLVLSGYVAAGPQVISEPSTTLLLYGTEQTQGLNGIASMRGTHGSGASLQTSDARNVDASVQNTSLDAATHSAQRPVRPPNVARQALTTRTASAQSAAPLFGLTDTERPAHVHGHVAHICGIESAPSCPVYNLTIDGPHEYFAGGILVSNCDAGDYLLWQEFNVLTPAARMHSSTFRL